jgi:ATP-dependent Lhr-like helicase
MYDCLHEAMDIEGLQDVVRGLETGAIAVHCVDTTEPSALSHEILNSRPYTFLDDAPLEERRTRAVQLRRGLPVDAKNLGALDPDAIARVRAEAAAQPRDADELHDLLVAQIVCRPRRDDTERFDELVAARRAAVIDGFWVATEMLDWAHALRPTVLEAMACRNDGALPPESVPSLEEAAARCLRGHLDGLGPVTARELEDATGLSATNVAVALAQLETEGFALRGRFDHSIPDEQFCARRLLSRIHGYTQKRLRREIEPVTAQDFIRFLLRWQHVAPDTQQEGRRGLLKVIEQLQGFELSAGAWEQHVLPARVAGYRADVLDKLCHSGDLAWARLGLRATNGDDDEPAPTTTTTTTSRATPVALILRNDLPWLLQAARGDARPAEPSDGPTRLVIDELRARGALFHGELTAVLQSSTDVEDALWDGVARGLITADGFGAIRSLLNARLRATTRSQLPRRGLRRGATARVSADGRWCLVPNAAPIEDVDDLAEAIAEQLLARWGVVFRDLMVRETLALPWRDVLYALRRMEARGTARGGRFVTGFTGEQYALPDAVDALRRLRKTERTGERVIVSGADPLNLVGILTPGPRIPAVRTNEVVYIDGLPASLLTAEPALLADVAAPAAPAAVSA